METGIKSSFIPQASIAPMRGEPRRGGFDFFILLAIVIFVASAALAVGVFLYAQFLSTSAASKLGQLERAKQAFEPSLINELTRLDDRMRVADSILQSHTAPTTLFRLLEQLTLQTVAFTTLDFSTSPDGIKLSMQGVAQSVNSIALQAELLAKSGIISNPIFSDINRQIDGVHFNFIADINPAALRYDVASPQSIDPQQQLQQQQPTEGTPASPFGTPDPGTNTQPQPTTP